MTEKTEQTKGKIEPRNDWRSRHFRHFTQSLTIFPSKEADLAITLGEAISSGIDVQVMGIEGNVKVKTSQTEYESNVHVDLKERLPKFSVVLNDGTSIDLSNLRVAVDLDYKKCLFPSKTESFGRPNEIEDTGQVSDELLVNYEKYDLAGKYKFCNHQIAYLTKLLSAHELEVSKLVYRFEQANKKLYTQRHLLLISRVEAVKGNLIDVKAWLNDVLIEMEINKVISEGFSKKVST